MQFTKLFNSILDSTIWQEAKETKLVWITMLAMCDKNGEIHASIPGLAVRSGVTISECEAALLCLLSEDKYSRTKTDDGRRIAEIDGGWVLINHGKYRQLLSQEERREYLAKKQREHRAKMAKKQDAECQQLSTNVTYKSTKSTHTEADTDTDTEALRERERAGGNPVLETRSKKFVAAWQKWKLHSMDKGKAINGVSEESQLQMLLGAYPDELDAIAAIEHAIVKNWANVNLGGDHKKPESKPHSGKRTTKEEVDDILKRTFGNAG